MTHEAPQLKVPVGTPVWYLQYGKPEETPLPGTVVAIADNLVCKMQVISPDGVVLQKHAVYPFGHPSLTDDKGAPTQNVLRNGAWVYHPWFKPSPRPDVSDIDDEMKDMVKSLFEKHGDVDAVFARVRGKGVSKAAVSEILSQ